MARKSKKEAVAEQDDSVVSFSVERAKIIGVYAAILAPYIDDEIIEVYPAANWSYKYAKGRWWVRISMDTLKEKFPFFTEQELARTIRSLEKRRRYTSYSTTPGNGYAERWYSFHPATLAVALRIGVEFPPPPEDNHGFVYLLEGVGCFKIGKSKEVSERTLEIEPRLPFPISLVSTIYYKDMTTGEKEWHTRFEDKRLNGEWFALDEDDVSLFVACSQESNPPE